VKIIHDRRCTEYVRPGHPERPDRITKTLARLRQQDQVTLTWGEPAPVSEAQILRAHDAAHCERLKALHDFDADTPALPGIADHARRAVGAALEALQAARKGETSFSLMRPPGHHATRNRAMGFCYLNNIAIGVLEAIASGVNKVAVFDFDLHHGNGTEAILLKESHCAIFSIHQYPAYPGTGDRTIERSHNYPVPPHTPRTEHRAILAKALAELKQYRPDLVAVSAGFDAYAHDPLGQELLETEDYFWLGEELRRLQLPLFSVLEGGYSDDLPELILAYLKGLAGR
jgi:acetoin utilization deacetylase AcuC-like enzyme